MVLSEEFRSAVESAARGRTTLAELEDWLASHVQALAQEPGHKTQPLADEAWSLLADYGHRCLTKEGLERELSELAGLSAAERAAPGRESGAAH